jgi:hypothetical protein
MTTIREDVTNQCCVQRDTAATMGATAQLMCAQARAMSEHAGQIIEKAVAARIMAAVHLASS